MLTPALIVLAIIVLGVGIVVWATRRKPAQPPVGPRETDTAWNDPVTSGEAPTPRETFTHEDAPSASSQEPRP
ncbi:hypothetical protein N0B44_06925 [Roseibacterium beibuensis]|uniref:hypothetical protein n=1 Tax=[Roseibacterium] beibuensis TaxID=1193142 RepID=UPI00217D37A7|nr:hypothetical protein [Roseibacterium beibuensis]MCS6622636.1 hypothetical protein [Roseibacterium beibuensis]